MERGMEWQLGKRRKLRVGGVSVESRGASQKTYVRDREDSVLTTWSWMGLEGGALFQVSLGQLWKNVCAAKNDFESHS
jgi:hypothetical protein